MTMYTYLIYWDLIPIHTKLSVIRSYKVDLDRNKRRLIFVIIWVEFYTFYAHHSNKSWRSCVLKNLSELRHNDLFVLPARVPWL